MAQSGIWAIFKPFIIGSLSGCIATSVVQPIDTIKVVIQNKRQAAGRSLVSLSPLAVGKQIVQKNGVASLYKGLDSAILRQFVYSGIRLGMFKSIQNNIKHKHNRNLTFTEKVQYSLLTGAIGSAIASPTDLALIRMQADNSLPPENRRNYKNVFEAISRIYKEEGIRGLWRGAVPTMARAMVLNASQLSSYNEAKEELMKLANEKNQTMSIRLASSALSGISIAIFTLPFDNVKTKIMRMKPNAQGVLPYSGFANCFIKSIKNEGFFGLWVGIATFYMRVAPHAMITVLAQDFFHDIFSPQKH